MSGGFWAGSLFTLAVVAAGMWWRRRSDRSLLAVALLALAGGFGALLPASYVFVTAPLAVVLVAAMEIGRAHV